MLCFLFVEKYAVRSGNSVSLYPEALEHLGLRALFMGPLVIGFEPTMF